MVAYFLCFLYSVYFFPNYPRKVLNLRGTLVDYFERKGKSLGENRWTILRGEESWRGSLIKPLSSEFVELIRETGSWPKFWMNPPCQLRVPEKRVTYKEGREIGGRREERRDSKQLITKNEQIYLITHFRTYLNETKLVIFVSIPIQNPVRKHLSIPP